MSYFLSLRAHILKVRGNLSELIFPSKDRNVVATPRDDRNIWMKPNA